MEDINAELAAAYPSNEIIAGRSMGRIILAAIAADANQIRVGLDVDEPEGEVAQEELGFDDGFIARADDDIRFFIDNFEDNPLLTVDLSITADEILPLLFFVAY